MSKAGNTPKAFVAVVLACSAILAQVIFVFRWTKHAFTSYYTSNIGWSEMAKPKIASARTMTH
jgi:hypothetical protein